MLDTQLHFIGTLSTRTTQAGPQESNAPSEAAKPRQQNSALEPSALTHQVHHHNWLPDNSEHA